MIRSKSDPKLLCVFIMTSCNTFCFEMIFALVEILFLVWCFGASCFLGILNYVLQTMIRSKVLRIMIDIWYVLNELHDYKDVSRYYLSSILLRGSLNLNIAFHF